MTTTTTLVRSCPRTSVSLLQRRRSVGRPAGQESGVVHHYLHSISTQRRPGLFGDEGDGAVSLSGLGSHVRICCCLVFCCCCLVFFFFCFWHLTLTLVHVYYVFPPHTARIARCPPASPFFGRIIPTATHEWWCLRPRRWRRGINMPGANNCDIGHGQAWRCERYE
jgi:hypothetical protein